MGSDLIPPGAIGVLFQCGGSEIKMHYREKAIIVVVGGTYWPGSAHTHMERPLTVDHHSAAWSEDGRS